MVRPACPACSDNYSVAKVSALYHSVTGGYDSLTSDDLDPDDVHQAFAPPTPPGRFGRYLAAAVAAGLIVYVASAFTVMWLYIALSIGVVAAGFSAIISAPLPVSCSWSVTTLPQIRVPVVVPPGTLKIVA